MLRLAMLLVAALAMLAAFGGLAADVQPSALRVGVAAAITLLAPMFWPGAAASGATPVPESTGRLAGTSLLMAVMAALLMVALGRGHQDLSAVVQVGALLWPLLLLTRGLALVIQRLWRGLDDDPSAARWGAGLGAAVLVALLGSAPFWLGPAAERLAPRFDGAINGLLAASPLTHLSVASGLDLLRQNWLYQNSNLASLPADYPAPVHLAAIYGVACIGMLAAAAAMRRPLNPNPSNP